MELKDLITLSNMGWNKEEIISLLNPSRENSNTQDTVIDDKVTRETVVEKEVVKEPKTPNESITVEKSITGITDEQISKLAQLINRGNATMDLPEKKTIEDTLANHFTNLLGGAK